MKFVIKDIELDAYFCGSNKSQKWSEDIRDAVFISSKQSCVNVITLNARNKFSDRILEIKEVYKVK